MKREIHPGGACGYFVKAERVPLPNPLMGFMAGADGMFPAGMGEGGRLHALCLSCGRADQCSSATTDARRNRWKRITSSAPR
ncbi:hypothetical protein KCP75_23950 [Salmonella enterica subsp. enterica]|nr:hypothetical protein KCP75_23950 [Salmonella enterica subsp. enterica]